MCYSDVLNNLDPIGEAWSVVKMTEKEWDDKWEFVLGNCHLVILLLFSVTFILKFWMFLANIILCLLSLVNLILLLL